MNDTSSIAPFVLENLIPLRELTAEALEALAREAEIEEYPLRSVIFRKGSQDPWVRYLLSGSVLLTEREQGDLNLTGTGDTGAVADPLGFQQPHTQSAISRTAVRVLRVPRERVAQLLRDARLPEYDVAEVDEAQEGVGIRLFYQLFQDLQDDKLQLPSMPDIAVRVRAAVQEEDVSAPDLAKIIQNDPVVAARVIQAANSALYAGQKPVDSLTGAILRLGLRTTREVVTAVTMREVFKASSPLVNKRMVELWMHSSLVAATASVLAGKLRGLSAERGLLAGLVHDIGVVPMLAHAGSYPELARDPALLEATIAEFRGQVGALILRRWNFPEDLVEVPVEAENWMREHAGAPDYADLMIVAQLQILAGGGASAALPRLTEVPAYEKLGLAALGISDAAPILDEAREEIASVQGMLIG
jgi:HD-like signal output (HDOD) protein